MAGSFTSVPGSHNLDLSVHDHRQVTVASGHDSVAGGANLTRGVLGVGHDTIAALGGIASYSSGRTALPRSTPIHATEKSSGAGPSGKVTLLGSSGRDLTVTGHARDTKAATRVTALTGHDTMLGSKGVGTLEFLKKQQGAVQLLQDFASGKSKLHISGSSPDLLKSPPEASVSSHGGNTYIALDGGKALVELHGMTHLTSGINPHRH
jgi:hypothetical protein